MLDQRGTGASGALSCPVIQREDGLAPVVPSELADCAARIGTRRAFYSTVDSVRDIDALRQQLGVDKIALMGVSYGTFVAQQYARLFPSTPTGSSSTPSSAPTGSTRTCSTPTCGCRACCASSARRARATGITDDPVADVAALVGTLEKGGISGPTYDHRGRRHTTRYGSADDLANILIGADLNPYVQAALPAAIRAAAEGDPAMLLRLRRATAGPPTKLADLSAGLNVATNCQDTRLPYALSTPFADRPALLDQGLTLDDQALYPFTHATVESNSIAHDCLQWPDAEGISPPSTAPLPDVPGADPRRPAGPAHAAGERPGDRARAAARERRDGPRQRPRRARQRHHGLHRHGPAPLRRRTARWATRARAGRTPCRRTRSRRARCRGFRMAPGVGGARGRVVSAALVSALDARVSVLEDLFAGFEHLRGGGLRGGSYELKGSDRLVLHGYRYTRSVRISGVLRARLRHDEGPPARERPRQARRHAGAEGRRQRARHDRRAPRARAAPQRCRRFRLCRRCLCLAFFLACGLAFLPGISSAIPGSPTATSRICMCDGSPLT